MAKIEVRAIFELMGRPPEHVSETLNTLVVKIGSEKGIKIIDKKYHKPVAVKDAQNLFTAFAEVEIELDSIQELLLLIFAYTPSNLEVVSPENLKVPNGELNAFFNSLLDRMHNHGAILKKAVMERDILVNKIRFLQQELGDQVTKLLMPKPFQEKDKSDKQSSKPKKGKSKKSKE